MCAKPPACRAEYTTDAYSDGLRAGPCRKLATIQLHCDGSALLLDCVLCEASDGDGDGDGDVDGDGDGDGDDDRGQTCNNQSDTHGWVVEP